MLDKFKALVAKDSSGLSTMWLRGQKSQADKEALRKLLEHSDTQFSTLRSILEAMWREADTRTTDISNPNWKDVVAFETGYKKALLDVYKLVPATKSD